MDVPVDIASKLLDWAVIILLGLGSYVAKLLFGLQKELSELKQTSVDKNEMEAALKRQKDTLNVELSHQRDDLVAKIKYVSDQTDLKMDHINEKLTQIATSINYMTRAVMPGKNNNGD